MPANAGTVATAVIGGSIEVDVANAASGASAGVRGVPLAFVAPSAVCNGTHAVAAKGASFCNPTGLNGKTVAVVELSKLAQFSAQK